MIEKDLQNWIPCPRPSAKELMGQWCKLERLQANKHGNDLFRVSTESDFEEKFRYLFEYPPTDRHEFEQWLVMAEHSTDPFYYTIIDPQTGKAEGRQAFMRITPEQGVIEFGHLLWGHKMARSRIATEACFLMLNHAFEDLGYRRIEWKCHSHNMPSRNAALRFGFEFEGLFKQHMIFKGANRDTTWFSITDQRWPVLKQAFEAWLSPDNFDDNGQQKRSLIQFQELKYS